MYIKGIEKNKYSTFEARRVAMAKVKLPKRVVNYDIYELSANDEKFVERLKSKINLRSLWQGLSDVDYGIWKHIMQQALSVGKENSLTLLLTHQKKPCGALQANSYFGNSFIDYISTWPIQLNEKMPLAGKTLILQLFKQILKNNSSSISLNAIKDDPFGALGKYLSLGFESVEDLGCCETLKIEKNDVSKIIDMYSSLVELTSVNEEDVDLSEKFDT